MKEEKIMDITIIGAGPVGLFAAFYAGIRQAKTRIIDSLPELGGQLQMLYPEKYIYDIPGFPKIKAAELVQNLRTQISQFEHEIQLNEEVQNIEQDTQGIYRVKTKQGLYYSRSIIIAAGNGAFQPRKLQLENSEQFEQKQLHYHIDDVEKFKNKKVVIAGGGDSALDWALMLENVAKEVHLVHRRNEFRAHELTAQKVADSKIQVHTPFQIQNIATENEKLCGVGLDHLKEEQQEQLDCDHLIVNYGYSSNLGKIKSWGLSLERGAIQVHSDMATNLPGVYAIGDVCTYEGKVKLIATGFGEAPTAVNNALHYIRPEERIQPMHSTSLKFG